MNAPPAIHTVGELRASGHEARSVRAEIRANLLDALAIGRDPWPGLHGFGSTVIPQLERALLAGHDVDDALSAGQRSAAAAEEVTSPPRRARRARRDGLICPPGKGSWPSILRFRRAGKNGRHGGAGRVC